MSRLTRWLASQDWIGDACIAGEFVAAITAIILAAFYAVRGMYGWCAAFVMLSWLAAKVGEFMVRNK